MSWVCWSHRVWVRRCQQSAVLRSHTNKSSQSESYVMFAPRWTGHAGYLKVWLLVQFPFHDLWSEWDNTAVTAVSKKLSNGVLYSEIKIIWQQNKPEQHFIALLNIWTEAAGCVYTVLQTVLPVQCVDELICHLEGSPECYSLTLLLCPPESSGWIRARIAFADTV